MNIKKTFRNRVRGWFPQEPYLIKTMVRMNTEKQQNPLVIPADCNLSATKLAMALAIIWIVFYGYFSLINIRYSISAFQVMAWVIAGSAFGVLLHLIITKRQLDRLSRNYRMSPTGGETLLVIISEILFFIFAGFVSWFMSASLQLTLQGLLVSIYSWGVSIFITKPVLFTIFEKRAKMSIVQSWWGLEVFLIPKPPNRTVNGWKSRLHFGDTNNESKERL